MKNNFSKFVNKTSLVLFIIYIIFNFICDFTNINVINNSNLVYAEEINQIGNGFKPGYVENEMPSYYKAGHFYSTVSRITGVIIVVLQIASIAGIIFAGIKYMFTSADSRADIKSKLVYLVIGMIIIFGASTVIGFITGTFSDMTKPLQ